MAPGEWQDIECTAAIAWEAKKPLDVTRVIVAPPKAGEVRVKVRLAAPFAQGRPAKSLRSYRDCFVWLRRSWRPRFATQTPSRLTAMVGALRGWQACSVA